MSATARSRDETFMLLALEQVQLALSQNHYPCGCVIVSGDSVLAAGRNQVYRLGDATRHAEMTALESAFAKPGRASVLLHDATAYVTSTPCLMCAGAFMESGIRRVVFGAETRRYGGGSRPRSCSGTLRRRASCTVPAGCWPANAKHCSRHGQG